MGIEDELEVCMGSGWHKHNAEQEDYRNGYYSRDLDTELGPIDGINVSRTMAVLFKTTIFDRYSRRQRAVNDAICIVFLSGVSIREVSGVIKPLLETTFSNSCVSRVTKKLDAFVKGFHKKEFIDEYQYLFFDGVTLNLKGAVKTRKKLILVAYGLTVFGKKELIGFKITNSESQVSREAFLNDLQRRGLQGNDVKLIITDLWISLKNIG